MSLRSFIFRIVLVALVLTPSLWAQDGLRGAFSRWDESTGLFREALAQRFVAADFDQDQKPDGAVLVGGDYGNGQRCFRIELHVTASENRKLSFTSTESSLSLAVLDVNRDGTPDLVVEQVFTHKRVQIWLNDGHGLFRLVNSQDYPSESESEANLRALVTSEGLLLPFVLNRWGPDHPELIASSIGGLSLSSGQRLWSRALLRVSRPRAPNLSRGPPSLLVSLQER